MIPPSSASRRLAVVLSHPTQYYSPWFRWIRERTTIEMRVFYLWDFGVTDRFDPSFNKAFKWDVDLLSGYDYEFVPNVSRNPGPEHFFGFNNPSLSRRLEAWEPTDLLLFGYKWATHIRLILWANRRGIPTMFRGDSHLLGRGDPRLFTRLALSAIFSKFSSFLYVGTANRSYFEAFGVPAAKLFFAPHSVNAALFNREDPAHIEAARNVRAELGVADSAKVVLFAGKLTPAKQPAALLEAFLRIRRPDTVLVFVGDGPENARLRALAEDGRGKGEPARVRFLPFANQSEMPARYLIADLFVLPSQGSYETWGLAVNEAMHMGVPCLVSSRVGCQLDLVTSGKTGWVFDPTEPDALEAALSQAFSELESPERAAELRREVKSRVSEYDYGKTTEGLLAALSARGSKAPHG